jgi:uncharacterized protein YceH (UPF0502 family)
MLKLLKQLGIIALVSLTMVILLQTLSPAQSTARLESRISRLESQNTLLRSRVNRLENDISQLSRATGITISPPLSQEQEAAPPSTLSDDPMFDRLATLVIELRDRIIALEERLEQAGL